MPRPDRTDYPGAWHYVMNRGRRREPIFEADEHCLLFLELLGEIGVDSGVEVHAYSLMPNHFHLLLHSREPNLSSAMQRLVGRYTRRINARVPAWDGPLFRGRFKSQLVGDDDSRYLAYLFAYIHLNPVRAHLVSRADDECWTSHRALIGVDSKPEWLSTWMLDQLFDSREQFARFVDDLVTKRERWPDMDMETGWLKRRATSTDAGERIPLQDPEALMGRIREVTGTSQADIEASSRGRGANPVRRFAIWMLSQHTNASQRDIARHTGVARTQVASTLYAIRQRGLPDQFRQWERALDLPTSF